VLLNCDDYRRRTTVNRRPKLPCPYPGCNICVTHIGNHLRRKHQTTAFAMRHQANTPSISAAVRPLTDTDTDNCVSSPELIPPSPQPSATSLVFPSTSFAHTSQTSVPHECSTGTQPLATANHAASDDRSRSPSPQPSSDEDLFLDTVAEGDNDNADFDGGVSESDTGTSDNQYITTIVAGFEQHMSSIDGGSRSRPEMYSLAVKQILAAVGNSMSDLTKDNVRLRYIEPKLSMSTNSSSQLSIKTMRNKLLSLEYFSAFVLEVLKDADASDAIVVENLRKLHSCLPSWRKSLRGRCTAEDVRRRVQDGTEQLLPSDINNYLTSEYASYASHLLHSKQSVEHWTPTLYDFTRARNHLLVLLCVGNAHRTGVLINFSLSDYHSGLEMSDGSFVYSVSQHKTASTHGAATIAVNAEEAVLLENYVKMRMSMKFPNSAAYVFINHTGRQMTQSNIASALTVAFNKCGFSDRVTCTKVRKAAVTQVHSSHPQKRHDVANHMCHRVSTAEKHYRFIEKQNNSIECSALLRKTLTDPSAPVPVKKRKVQEKTVMNSLQCSEQDQDSAEGPYKKRVIWNTEDRDLVRKKFDIFVKRQKTPIREIAAVLESDVQLRSCLESNLQCVGDKLARAVRDKVRSFFRWL